jgi:hypothetical protein
MFTFSKTRKRQNCEREGGGIEVADNAFFVSNCVIEGEPAMEEIRGHHEPVFDDRQSEGVVGTQLEQSRMDTFLLNR